jgi:SDR family mycofactocin-dependent oxidoreductase
MGRMEGKVALITGAARGQGRAHAVALAEEGADIIAVDACRQFDTIAYPMASAEDLAETAALVEKTGQRVLAIRADVRDSAAINAAAAAGRSEFGHIDVLCANAGIFASAAPETLTDEQWDDVIGVNLTGVFRTVRAVLPIMLGQAAGGSIVLTGSVASRKGLANCAHYTASKHGVLGLMRSLVQDVSARKVRVNCVLPTSVGTDMIYNEAAYELFSPDSPSRENFEAAVAGLHLLPVGPVPAADISRAVVWLASDEARYVTGIALPVDAGFHEKTS